MPPPEQQSPYWDKIVGDNWPEIPPGAWSALADATREGAAALNVLDAPQALRSFDDMVVESEALRPVRDAMAVLQHYPQRFADALNAAADTFDTFADLVRRTRNRILDVVDDATTRMHSETRGDNNGDGETDDEAEAATDAATRETILREARAEVVDIVSAALGSLGPQGLPELDDIAHALGQPGPWKVTGPLPEVPLETPPGADGRHPLGPGPHHRPLPFPPGFGPPGPPGTSLPRVPLTDIPIGLPDIPVLDLGDLPLVPEFPDNEAAAPIESDQPALTVPTDPAAPAPAEPAPAEPGTAGPAPDGRQADQPPAVDAAGPVHSGSNTAGPDSAPGDRSSSEAGSSEAVHQDTAAPGDKTAERSTTTDTTKPSAPDRLGSALPHHAVSASADPASAPVVPPVMPPPVAAAPNTGAPPPTSTTAPTNPAASPTTPNPSAPARPAAVTPSEAPRVQPAAAASSSAAPSSGVTAAPAGKSQPPSREAFPGARPGEGTETPDKGRELVKDAVGAAMLASAAPAFVVGERVDGDLVLARTLLAGIRAAVGSWLIGVEWAVSVMRHPSGVSAFVTSNEGRGWLPTGLYLPREVTTPWMWSVAEDAAWEGVADPARILAEFALAWGAKSGAKLSAVASSQPIDPALRGQLGDIPMVGPVPASDEMDLGRPTDSTLDRLGIVGSPRLLDRAAKVPDGSLGQRCLEYAVDAHMRVTDTGLARAESMGAPDIRLRILRALRHGREFPETWWEELQDADDLLAASVLSNRLDVGRIPVGELRSASDSAVLRGLGLHRRCNELVLLLQGGCTRQTLRDVVFAHAQVRSHPLLGDRPPTDPGPGRETGRSAVSAGGPR